MILVFGCRQSEMDHIYKEETIQARNKGVFKELYTVYSREPGKPKVVNHGTTYNPSLPSFLPFSAFCLLVYLKDDNTSDQQEVKRLKYSQFY